MSDTSDNDGYTPSLWLHPHLMPVYRWRSSLHWRTRSSPSSQGVTWKLTQTTYHNTRLLILRMSCSHTDILHMSCSHTEILHMSCSHTEILCCPVPILHTPYHTYPIAYNCSYIALGFSLWCSLYPQLSACLYLPHGAPLVTSCHLSTSTHHNLYPYLHYIHHFYSSISTLYDFLMRS